MHITTFHFTTHAGERARQRNLSSEDMKCVVNYHETKKLQYKGDHGGNVYRMSKTVNGKTLIVVAEVKKSECWLLTGWIKDA